MWNFIPSASPAYMNRFVYPIGSHSDDPDDLSYLTLDHFLIGAYLASAHGTSVELVPENGLNTWQIVQRIATIFWRRWSVGYLRSLIIKYHTLPFKMDIVSHHEVL